MTSDDAEDRRDRFLKTVARLEQWLDGQEIPHRIVGSLAVSAYIDGGRSLDFDRPGAYDESQRMPDIDLLVPRNSLARVQPYADAVARSDFPVSIGTLIPGFHIDLRPDARNHGDVG